MVSELSEKQRTSREKSNSNLKPFKPGQSGNPAGRPPKGYSVTSQAKLLIDNDPAIARRIAHKWLNDAIKGKTEARRDFQDRTEGKVTEEHNINLDTTVHFIVGKGYAKTEGKES